ncbi:MAG: hypothetical protein LBK55_06460 [Azoarcus sp.]|jgi:hypothetical protein|nr:hypothetical protein [Azoarcus sp.]
MNFFSRFYAHLLRYRQARLMREIRWINANYEECIADLRAASLRVADRLYQIDPEMPPPRVTVTIGSFRTQIVRTMK